MAHGGCAGGSAEKILRLPILPEGSDRRHKQTARPWTLRRKPVPGENLAIITRRELAGHHPHPGRRRRPLPVPGHSTISERLTPAWHVQGNRRPVLTSRPPPANLVRRVTAR
jgi:hypothetical protein